MRTTHPTPVLPCISIYPSIHLQSYFSSHLHGHFFLPSFLLSFLSSLHTISFHAHICPWRLSRPFSVPT